MAEIEVNIAGAEPEEPPDPEPEEIPPDDDDSGSRRRDGRSGTTRRQRPPRQQRPQRNRQRRQQQHAPRERTRSAPPREGNRGNNRRQESRDRDGDREAPARQQARQPEPIEELTPEDRQKLEEVTGEVLGRLISNMQVRVDAYVLDDLRDGALVFEIEGEDAGLLIGRRGETLRDLQSIVRLLVGRKLERRPSIIIDVEQYQDRRRNRLQNIAERAARNAARNGDQRLEPMSSDERRLIHIALAEDPDVVTESEGEGDERHVVVKPRD